MNATTTRLAGIGDAAAVAAMLSRLAQDIGDADVFHSDEAAIATYGFGADRLFFCQIAEADGNPVGLALYFPSFSTTKGLPGAYVQDLWVDPLVRGHSVGSVLLGAVAEHAALAWHAGYLKLTAYTTNSRAIRFYQRLGFKMQDQDRPMILTGAGFASLRGAA